jgi:enoyl-CoA hydratase/carnithine racemase
MSDTSILVERLAPGVAKVVLNAPPMNLNTLASVKRLQEVFAVLDGDASVRCIVVAGATARAFSAGSDIKEFPAIRDDVAGKKLRRENDAFRGIETCAQPVIAAIEGLAYGGGLELALACDLRVMAEDAKVALPEVKLGVVPGSGGLYRLPRLVGPAKAMEMMLFGAPLTAAEALQIGLINRIAPAGQAVEVAMEMADQLARQAVEAVRAIKRGVRESLTQRYEEARELTLQLSDQVFRTPDCGEGVKAFIEKRPPRFG